MHKVPAHYVALALLGLALPQQISFVDLTRPAPVSVSKEPSIPAGCEKLQEGGIADGWPQPEDHKPRHIVVAVVRSKDMRPAIGSEVEAQVQLRNSDTHSIQIPWSTDPNVIWQGQDRDSPQWEGGTFEFHLKDQKGRQVRLISLTQWLHGSKFVSGSLLTIQPGQSVAALVKFKVENRWAMDPLLLKEGNWKLSAEWHQVGRAWHINRCTVWNAYFDYEHFYEQENLPLSIQVTPENPSREGTQ